jgi:DNA-binding transcriptional LysR family regulator
MRDAGLIELRRHYPDIVRQRARDLLDNLQAGGMDAVVIGAKNSHPVKCPFRSMPWQPVCRLYPAGAAEANPAVFSQNAYQRWWPRTNEAIGEWRLRSLQRRNAHEQDLNSKGW